MKKTLLSIFTVLGFVTSAQTLTYLNHAAAWGNIRYQTQQFDSAGVTPGASGALAAWSYTPTNLNSLKSYTTSNTLPNNLSYPAANVSVYSSVTEVAYYNTNPNINNYYGGNLSIGGNNITIKYSSPAIFAIYPMALNTSTTSITSGSVSVLAFSGTFNGTCNVIADATGTLVLPAKTFSNVIRVNTVQNINAILSIGTATVTLNNYDYYEAGTSKAPLFSISSSTLLTSLGAPSYQKITTILKDYNIVGINESQKSVIELSVFPNPATNLINFTTLSTEAIKIIAFDVTGKIIATELLEMGKAKMNLTNLSSGIYIYHVVDKNNQVLTTGKFNVTK